MFTESVRVGCSILACHGGSAKYQTCLIFHQPSMTLHPDSGFSHLETVLSWISTACQLHFLSFPTLLPSCLEKLPVLSCSSTRTPPQDRSATLTDRAKHFHQHQPPLLQPPPPHSKNISSHQPSLRLLRSQPTPSSSHRRTYAKPSVSLFQDHYC